MDGAPVGKELGRYSFQRYVQGEGTRAGGLEGDGEAGKTEDDGRGIPDADGGSIMMVVATDAPLSSRNLERLARRALMGLARTGSSGGNGSGDYVLAFSTAPGVRRTSSRGPREILDLPNDDMAGLFQAAIETTEEAIYNSLLKATDVTGRDGRMVRALPLDEVLDVLRRFGVVGGCGTARSLFASWGAAAGGLLTPGVSPPNIVYGRHPTRFQDVQPIGLPIRLPVIDVGDVCLDEKLRTHDTGAGRHKRHLAPQMSVGFHNGILLGVNAPAGPWGFRITAVRKASRVPVVTQGNHVLQCTVGDYGSDLQSVTGASLGQLIRHPHVDFKDGTPLNLIAGHLRIGGVRLNVQRMGVLRDTVFEKDGHAPGSCRLRSPQGRGMGSVVR